MESEEDAIDDVIEKYRNRFFCCKKESNNATLLRFERRDEDDEDDFAANLVMLRIKEWEIKVVEAIDGS